MIRTQIIRREKKPIAVIMDYEEYRKLKEIEEDALDYRPAAETKEKNRNWTSHSDLKKQLGIE